ncbi:uncharacterized protein LOC110980395 [Acanthaster planci]|uniref:Uncharacterized protein LOC110980395 n=1 Tax=Acanthaster planci TaxID=133434 RepID=A0A8B7YHJ6_ACAPL|nr:uncharacterized protein LOC110980395 [Acanthaster planci]XP_022092723.1 uncharacterized protein LOC110980395 [Acanthaster planci]
MSDNINQQVALPTAMLGAPLMPTGTTWKLKSKKRQGKKRPTRAEFSTGPEKKGKGSKKLLGRRMNIFRRESTKVTDPLDALERGHAADLVDIDTVQIKTSPQKSDNSKSGSSAKTEPSPSMVNLFGSLSSTRKSGEGEDKKGTAGPSGLAKKGGLVQRVRRFLRELRGKGTGAPKPLAGSVYETAIANGSPSSQVLSNGSTREWDRWRSVKETYTGRYTSKVSPLKTEKDTSSASTAGSGGSIPPGVGASSKPVGPSQLLPGLDPRSPAAWAITDWTSHRREGQGQSSNRPQSQSVVQAAQLPSQPRNVTYHGAGLATDTSQPTPVEQQSSIQTYKDPGYRRTHRIIVVKPRSSDPFESS